MIGEKSGRFLVAVDAIISSDVINRFGEIITGMVKDGFQGGLAALRDDRATKLKEIEKLGSILGEQDKKLRRAEIR